MMRWRKFGSLLFYVITNIIQLSAYSATQIPEITIQHADQFLLHDHANTTKSIAVTIQQGNADKKIDALTFYPIKTYATHAKIYAIDESGQYEIPHSQRLHFIATTSKQRMSLSMDPDGSHVSGLWFDGAASYSLQGHIEKSSNLKLSMRDINAKQADGSIPSRACDSNPVRLDDLLRELSTLTEHSAPKTTPTQKSVTRQAIVAVDTDNEFMQRKFSGTNTTAATDYIADLFANMNLIYEAQNEEYGLNIHLAQGTTFIRTTDITDPYATTSSSSTFSQLSEFGEYWRTTYSGLDVEDADIDRTFVMQLSGKSSNASYSAGIAWVLSSGNYCALTGVYLPPPNYDYTYGHYSISRVFYFSGADAADDTMVVSHELGHNFGANHTHCSDGDTGAGVVSTNTIDQCYNGESVQGCYSGPESCPTGDNDETPGYGANESPFTPAGTLMSYCHTGSQNCRNSQLDYDNNGIGDGVGLGFHPAHVSFLGTRIASNEANSCITGYTDVNQDPEIILNQSLQTNEDTPLAIHGLIFDDPDAGNADIKVQLQVSDGSLSATESTSYTITGNGTDDITITGPLDAINSLVTQEQLIYTTELNQYGNIILNINIDDLGNTGVDGAKTATLTTTITVVSINDIPQADAQEITLDENTSQAILLSGSDIETASEELSYIIANLPEHGTLEGTPPEVTYTASSDDAQQDAFTFIVNDGGGNSAPATISVIINPINDPPSLTLTQSEISIDEDTSLPLTHLSVSDADAGTDSMILSLHITNGQGELQANITSEDNITVSMDENAQNISLSGSLTALNQALLNGQIIFSPVPNISGEDTDVTLSINVDDLGHTGSGGNLTDSTSYIIHITPVNDAPIASAPPSIAINDDPTQITAISGITITDVDDSIDPNSTSGNTPAVTIRFVVSVGELLATPDDTIIINVISNQEVQLSGSLADINVYLENNLLSYKANTIINGLTTLSIYGEDAIGGSMSYIQLALSNGVFYNGFEVSE